LVRVGFKNLLPMREPLTNGSSQQLKEKIKRCAVKFCLHFSIDHQKYSSGTQNNVN